MCGRRNSQEYLKQTVPEGEGWEGALWRKGAFEVLRKDTGMVLYSKKGAGEHLVDGKGGPEGKLGMFCSTVMASMVE